MGLWFLRRYFGTQSFDMFKPVAPFRIQPSERSVPSCGRSWISTLQVETSTTSMPEVPLVSPWVCSSQSSCPGSCCPFSWRLSCPPAARENVTSSPRATMTVTNDSTRDKRAQDTCSWCKWNGDGETLMRRICIIHNLRGSIIWCLLHANLW